MTTPTAMTTAACTAAEVNEMTTTQQPQTKDLSVAEAFAALIFLASLLSFLGSVGIFVCQCIAKWLKYGYWEHVSFANFLD